MNLLDLAGQVSTNVRKRTGVEDVVALSYSDGGIAFR
jgi:hypothetical protein